MKFPSRLRLAAAGCLLLCLVTSPIRAQIQIQAVTSKEREAQYAAETEQSPLGATSAGKRAAALLFVENDHAHHVAVCGPLFKQLLANRQRHANDINSQFLISAAAYLYEHPDSTADPARQSLAGLRAALVVYEKFLAVDPSTRVPFLDSLLQQRTAGTLDQALPAACKAPPKP